MFTFDFAPFPAPLKLNPEFYDNITDANRGQYLEIFETMRSLIQEEIDNYHVMIQELWELPANKTFAFPNTLATFMNYDKYPSAVFVEHPRAAYLCLMKVGKDISLEDHITLAFNEYALNNFDVLDQPDRKYGRLRLNALGMTGYILAQNPANFILMNSFITSATGDHTDELIAWTPIGGAWESRQQVYGKPKTYAYTLASINRTNEYRIMVIDAIIATINGEEPAPEPS